LCGERRLECEAVGAFRRCGSCPGRAVRALSAAPLGVPGKALRLRWPGG